MNHLRPPCWASCFTVLALVTSLFLTNSAHAQSGPGHALLIAGDFSYVAVPHAASFNSLPITIMAWVNTTVTLGQQGLVNKYVANSRNGWNLFLLNGRVHAWYFVSGTRNVWGGGDGLDGGFIADGKWHHIALVVDSSGASIYVDGIETASRLWTGAFGPTTTSQEVRIGSYPGGNNGFAGSIFIDDVRMWTTNLSFSRIQNIMNGGVTGLEATRQLALYRCDEGGDSTVADSAPLGGSNSGTWVGLALSAPVTPSVQTSAASAVGFTQATLGGIANPNRSTITMGFEWGTTTNYGGAANVSTVGSPSANSDQLFSLIITGLTFETTYHFRAFASNSANIVFGPDQSFLTRGVAVATLPAHGVTETSATLNGTANPDGLAASAWFEFGFTTNYGNVTTPQALGSGNAQTNFSQALTGLVAGFYHFRVVVSNAFGLAVGTNQSFKTLGLAVATLPASSLTQTSATLNGTVDTSGLNTTTWFEWGLTTNYGSITPPQVLGTGQNEVTFSNLLSSLFPAGTFHFRAVASNEIGVATGADQSLPTPAPEFTALAIPGGVSVTIQPPEAVADGARWILDGGVPRPSGFPLPAVAPGAHTVRFGNLANWREPQAIDVFVIGGRTSEVAAVFTPIATFDFQAVPEQHARPGETVEFFVTGPSNATLQVTATPPPAGTLTFDAGTGRISYTPGAGDRLPFSLMFSTGGVLVATTVITPLPEGPLEDVVIGYDRPLPDGESRDYITISENLNPVELFNNFTNQTLSVDISGRTLVFEANHPARLLQQYSGRETIKEFRLYADRVIIRSPLLLPQTHVTVHARELRFEGNGVLDTTPRSQWEAPRPVVWEDDNVIGFPGSAGHNGGDADIFVERFHADPTPAIRFVLRGGDGGPPGEGRDGMFEGRTEHPGFFPGLLGLNYPTFVFTNQDGIAVETNSGFAVTNWNRLMARAGNPTNCGVANNTLLLYSETRRDGVLDPALLCGSQTAVARGEPAVPSGIPGAGGRGGTLRSTLNLAAHADLAGGAAGTNGGNYVGGALVYQYRYRFINRRTLGPNPGTDISFTSAPRVPGANATAPTNASGASGGVVVASDPASWLHSFGVRAVLQFVRDAYLNERTTEARALLADYRDAIRALQPPRDPNSVTNLSDAEFAETTGLDQLAQDIDTLVHRIDSNLDFFGNPAGFVPMLSFEANLTVFQQEVDQSIKVLYLASWLSHAATNLQDSLAASGEAVVKLREELRQLVVEFNQAQLLIPSIQSDSAILSQRIVGLKGRLRLLEQELLARAQNNIEDRNKLPFWKKALGTLSIAADLVPIGQPTIGRIGAGLGVLANVDPDKPLASLQANKTNIFAIAQNKDFSLCITNSPPCTNGCTPEAIEAGKKADLSFNSNCTKFLGDELEELGKLFKEVQVDSKALAAELEKLKAADPVFQAVTAELKPLNKDKERVAQRLAVALQAVSTLRGAINKNSLSTHELEQRIAHTITALDHNALLHVKEMERRAKDRLLKFQYFVAKAFQYRVLQPYSGNLQLTRILDRFQILVESTNSHVLSAEEFDRLKGLYVDELREIVSQTFAPLNVNAPERSQPASFSLVPEELEQLNRDGRLVINLRDKGFFASATENIRIVDLRTSRLDVRPVGGSIGGVALCFVDFEHQGISRLTRGGQSFLFRHYQTEAVNPITWNAQFDGIAQAVTHSVPSPAGESLIRTLINQPNDDKLLLYSRPSADADILITKTVSTDNGINLVIDALSVQVQYEFFNTTSTRPELTVNVLDDLQPVIIVSQTDLNGRRDGQGDFRRVYASGAPVTLQAPARYGGRAFDRWLVNHQPRAAGAVSLTLTMTAPTLVEARYVDLPSPPTIVLPPEDLEVTVGGTATFTVTAIGTAPLTFQWRKNGALLTNGARISGAATATLTVSNVDLSDAASYSVGISNALGTRTSPAALLTVTAPALSLLPAGPGQVGFQFPTVVGRRYIIEQKFRLQDPQWTVVQSTNGTGALMQFTRPTGATSSFFRLRVDENSL